ncbi:MAG: efflux RND transporter periplasmic adaptor subunit [Bacillota bacterium]|nr:efflux RND transporter periplasmic adaptor subunit [Bacillota bacterium]
MKIANCAPILKFIIANNFVEIPFLDINESKIIEEIKEDLGVPIRTTKIRLEEIDNTISYLGNLSANQTGMMSSKYGGYIKSIFIEDGEIVEEGQEIMRLDDKDINLSIESLNINLAEAKLNYNYLYTNLEKIKELYDSGAVPKNELDKITHEYTMAGYKIKEIEMGLKTLYSKKEDMIITASISGKVRGFNKVIGDMVQPGMVMFMIDDISSLYVEVKMPESDLNKLEIGSNVYLNYNDTKIESVVNLLPDSINEKTRIGIVEIGPISLDQMDNVVLDSTVNTEFIIDSFGDVLLINKNAVKTIGNNNYIYLLSDEKVIEKEIKIIFTQNNNVVITGDVKKDDVIASSNLAALYNGAKVLLFEEVE